MATKINIEEKLTENVKTANAKVKSLHKQLLKFTDETLDNVLATGNQWQDILSSSIQKGNNLMSKQQDLVFDTLEDIFEMHNSNVKRFQKLIQFKETKKPAKKAKKEKAAAPVVKKAKAEVKATVAKVTENITTPAEAAPAKNKSLQLINGIGPKLEGIFKAAGIQSLSDLATTPIEKISDVLANAGSRYKSLDPTKWIEEAKQLLK